jgi:hypothetical protein
LGEGNENFAESHGLDAGNQGRGEVLVDRGDLFRGSICEDEAQRAIANLGLPPG